MTTLLNNKARWNFSGTPEEKLKYEYKGINSFDLLNIQIKPTLPRKDYKTSVKKESQGKMFIKIINADNKEQ